jgi:L-alanine-DL-glutamate epimerase-like enolase superfamily enzyme
VGGISEQRRIAWMADDFGVRYVGHGWNQGNRVKETRDKRLKC